MSSTKKNSKAVAIIPARIGSKRIPQKNLKSFFGKPMIQYSIEAAIASKLFDRVIVSTDSPQIQKLAIDLGADAPFSRPANLSDDHTPLAGVVSHSLEWLAQEQDQTFESACCILATAPFIRVQDLQSGYQLLKSSGVSSVVPVTSFPYPIFRALDVQVDQSFKMFWPEHELTRSNDLPDAFHDVGQFYWLNTSQFRKQKRLFTADAKTIRIPRHLVQDIDTPEDWERAEKLFAAYSGPISQTFTQSQSQSAEVVQ